MKIKYNKNRNKFGLLFGILFSSLGFIQIFINNSISWFHYGNLIIGASYLIVYFFETKLQYLLINDGYIIKNTLFRKRIKLDNIVSIKLFAGDYILKTNTSEMRINSNIIDPESLTDLKSILNKLNLEQL